MTEKNIKTFNTSIFDRVLDNGTVEEKKSYEKEIKQTKEEVMLLQEKIAKLERKDAKRKESDEILDVLTNNPENLKLIAKAIDKLGLVEKLIKI